MPEKNQKFKLYGWIGLIVMLIAEALLFRDVDIIKRWFTPIMWTGYIMFIDAVIFKLKGESLIQTRWRQFVFMIPFSVGCWLIFEAYNLHLQNWQYIGLPENLAVRYFAYFWAFTTIWPGVLLSYELLAHFGLFNGARISIFRLRKGVLVSSMVAGAIFLIVPVLVSQNIAKYLFGLVWMGLVFFFDPINYFIGAKSLFRDLENGRLNRLLTLFLAGAVCGFLWEFWNYWASAKWIYTLPVLTEPKIFEMPLFGFLGFLPFAVEIWVVWQFAVHLLRFDRN